MLTTCKCILAGRFAVASLTKTVNANYLEFSTSSFNALSPLDGRYSNAVSDLSPYFSEAALMRYRIKVEAEWIIHLVSTGVISQASSQESFENFKQQIRALYQNFNDTSAQRIKSIQKITNHDLKSVEYFIKQNISQTYREFIHFCCTSQDVNNLAYALMLQDFRSKVLKPKMETLIQNILEKSERWSDHVLLSRTHGQPATPSTLGKEFSNFAYRLGKQAKHIQSIRMTGKFNGAVGNYNSHYFSFPDINWRQSCRKFVEKELGLEFNPYTTQIESHDNLVRFMAEVGHFNTVSIGLCKDSWEYISKGYLTQKTKDGQIGSSTMPHKVNPIDFQNCQGNLGVANSLIDHFRSKLPISRLQRDLSDSTVLRNQGSIMGYSMIGYNSLIKGLGKIDSNKKLMEQDLQAHYEVITEAIQTELRKIGYPEPYQLLKQLSRGKKFNQKSLQTLIQQLNSKLGKNGEESIKKFGELNPHMYVGKASELAKQVREELRKYKV